MNRWTRSGVTPQLEDRRKVTMTQLIASTSFEVLGEGNLAAIVERLTMTDSANTWTTDAPRITDPETLARFQKVLENESPLIIEHKFYRGARSPHWFVADDYDELVAYLRTSTHPGDKFTVWHFGQCCRDDNVLTSGKCPDEDGKVPLGGAY